MKWSLLILIATLSAQVPLSPTLDEPAPPPPFELLKPQNNALEWDINMSPYAGGEDLLFAFRLFEKGLTAIESKMPMIYTESIAARAYRLAEMTLIYFPLSIFTSVVQHEVFGHGYRFQDDHSTVVVGYGFSAPPPYGSGDAVTHGRFNADTTSTTDLSSISIAGIEGQLILSELTKEKWLGSEIIDPRQSILYLYSRYALFFYGEESLDDDLNDGHDLVDYVTMLNLTYPEKKMTISRLRALDTITFIDPFTVYAIFSAFYYLSSGKETAIPMIRIYDWGYLFGAKLGLTPFGPEYFWDNYLAQKENIVSFYLKMGAHAGNTYEGIGALAPRMFSLTQEWNLGTRLDLWLQPKLLLFPGNIPITEINLRDPPDRNNPLYSLSEQRAKKWGGALSFIASYQRSPFIQFKGEFGYKTKGFLPGNSLYKAPIIRIAYSADF